MFLIFLNAKAFLHNVLQHTQGYVCAQALVRAHVPLASLGLSGALAGFEPGSLRLGREETRVDQCLK